MIFASVIMPFLPAPMCLTTVHVQVTADGGTAKFPPRTQLGKTDQNYVELSFGENGETAGTQIIQA
jgi:hypothetical protein